MDESAFEMCRTRIGREAKSIATPENYLIRMGVDLFAEFSKRNLFESPQNMGLDWNNTYVYKGRRVILDPKLRDDEFIFSDDDYF